MVTTEERGRAERARPVAATRIEALAEKRGIGQLEEARETLGVTAERLNSGRGNVVNWALPS
jgi:hypothetical protein